MGDMPKGWTPMPVTALLYINDLAILLAAKGSHVFVIEGDDAQELHPDLDHVLSFKILANSVIHGLSKCPNTPNGALHFVAWGDTALQFFTVRRDKSLVLLGTTAHVSTWIADVSFMREVGEGTDLQVCFLTAQNDLGLASLVLPKLRPASETDPAPRIAMLPTVKQIVLYCGHLISDGSEIVVASGTMFGQVLVWKCVLVGADSTMAWSSSLLASFHEHEGSVFGVAIKKTKQGIDYQSQLHIASCSDDRTIRIYSVSDAVSKEKIDISKLRTGFSAELTARLKASTSSGANPTAGHMSRVWSTKWLDDELDNSLLLSFGEDTTAQQWHVSRLNGIDPDIDQPGAGFKIQRMAVYGDHYGKNIWSSTVFHNGRSRENIVYTGGADGRITSFRLSTWATSMDDLPQTYELETPDNHESETDRTILEARRYQENADRLFLGLEGSWDMDRVLVSKRTEYPSGNFKGIATINRRPATDTAYDDEMLYREEGQFSTDSGFSFSAQRNYVYRFEKKTRTISAWFVKPDANEVVDYLFHKVEFSQNAGTESQVMTEDSATGYHLCVRDHYNAVYSFRRENGFLHAWTLSYFVTGPEKDYTATCRFSRISAPVDGNVLVNEEPLAMKNVSQGRESFRDYCWYSGTCQLSITSSGRLYIFNMCTHIGANDPLQVPFKRSPLVSQKVKPRFVGRIPALGSYSLMQRVGNLGILIADGDGNVYFANKPKVNPNEHDSYITKFWLFSSKVTVIKVQTWHSSGSILVFALFQCLNQNGIHWVCFSEKDLVQVFQNGGLERMQTQKLHLSTSAVITSACYDNVHNILVLGTRQGQIYTWLFIEADGRLNPMSSGPFSVSESHERNAITSILYLGPSSSFLRTDGTLHKGEVAELWQTPSMPLIASVGRDGYVRQHLLDVCSANPKGIVPVSAIKAPFGPFVEGFEVLENPLRILLWGFSGTTFVLYDLVSQLEIMKVECGNSHRKWDFTSSSSAIGAGGSFAWTQATSCHILIQKEPTYKLIGQGGHGREIKCLASTTIRPVGSFAEKTFIATAAEDTDIRLFEVLKPHHDEQADIASLSLRCVTTIRRHTTGPTSLQFAKLQNVMVSCGGKEELFVWRYSFYDKAGIPVPQILCVGTCPKATELGDTRIMDFDILEHHPVGMQSSFQTKPPQSGELIIPVVYSDSTLRIWTYTANDSTSFDLVAEATYSTNCLTCVKYVSLHDTHLVVAAASDGYLLLFSMPALLATEREADSSSQCKLLLRHCVHHNSVKSLDVRPANNETILVVTGGDDNAVAFTRIGINGNFNDANGTEPRFIVGTVRVPHAHTAAVNAIKFIDGKSGPVAENVGNLTAASTSNDQTVKLWLLQIHDDIAAADSGISVRKKTVRCEVADAACLESVSGQLIVAGVGMEFVAGSLMRQVHT